MIAKEGIKTIQTLYFVRNLVKLKIKYNPLQKIQCLGIWSLLQGNHLTLFSFWEILVGLVYATAAPFA